LWFCTLVLGQSTPLSSATYETITSILNTHNTERASWGSRQIVWDTDLQMSAQNWADQCNPTHSGNTSIGENIAAAAGQTTGCNIWLTEKPNYNCAALYPNSCTSACSHYSQMIWDATTAVGCGSRVCTMNSPFPNFPTWNFFVCQYSVAGNLANTAATPIASCHCAGKADNTACDDGNACTTGDKCMSGQCVGTPRVCTASDQCHNAGTCDPATGTCNNPPKTSGSSCSDSNACTTGDYCDAHGSCVSGTAVICPAPTVCHTQGTCDPVSGCSNPIAADGTACGAGSVCKAGVCTQPASVQRCVTSSPIFKGAATTVSTSASKMTPTYCKNTVCKNYPYGVVMNGNYCFCYSTSRWATLTVTGLSDSLCTSTCTGDATSKCGGPLANNYGYVAKAPAGSFGY